MMIEGAVATDRRPWARRTHDRPPLHRSRSRAGDRPFHADVAWRSPNMSVGSGVMSNFIEYCGLCGWALALAHAKSGDSAAIAGYCGRSDELDEAMAAFAPAYADQTERDHAAMGKAAKSKRLHVARAF
jgi:Uncharacterized protein conserved in bacteria (DUF2252)